MGHHSRKKTVAETLQFLSQFRREEDGAITWLACFIFLMILMVGGVSVDTMIAEMRRGQLQSTMDSAVLAAASLDQELEPTEVVTDYIEKSPIDIDLINAYAVESLGRRFVYADAETSSVSQILRIFNNTRDEEGNWTFRERPTMTMSTETAAEEAVGSLEIALVLDVSGSMNSNSRLTNLKTAAKDFVDTLTATTEEGKLSFSIVPYATQVSMPETLAAEFPNLSDEHTYSNCINFTEDDFVYPEIDLTDQFQRTMHFDPWNSNDRRDNDDFVTSPVCVEATDNTREMVVMQNDPTMLKNFIDTLWGGGNTSIDVGMKWGTSLLLPSIRPAIEEMSYNGHVPVAFENHPLDTDSGESMKIVVLMTDGQNTSQYFIEDDFRTGESNIWWNEQEEVYSVYIGQDYGDEDNDGNTTEPMFYWPHSDDWMDHAYGEGVYEETETDYECYSYRRNGSCRRYRQVTTTVTVNEPGSAEVVSYADLWARTSIKYNLFEHYYPWMNDSQAADDWFYDVRSYVGGTTKDLRTKAICDAAKEAGIVVFTIGFEAPTSGQEVLEDCASSVSHYFDVDGLEITDAFAAIASSIRQLRLIQ